MDEGQSGTGNAPAALLLARALILRACWSGPRYPLAYDQPRHIFSFEGGGMHRPDKNDGGPIQPGGTQTDLSTLVEIG